MLVTAMGDERIEKLAHILTEYSIPLEAGKTAVVQGSTLAEPLMLAIYERLKDPKMPEPVRDGASRRARLLSQAEGPRL